MILILVYFTVLQDWLPTNTSAIVVTDYDTVSQLVDAIKALNSDDRLYSIYINYKTTGVTNPRLLDWMKNRVWGLDMSESSFFDEFSCYACQMLHGVVKSTKRSGEELSLNCPLPDEFNTDTESLHDKLVTDSFMWHQSYNSEIFKSEVLVKLILKQATEVSKRYLEASYEDYIKKSFRGEFGNSL